MRKRFLYVLQPGERLMRVCPVNPETPLGVQVSPWSSLPDGKSLFLSVRCLRGVRV